MGFLLKKLIQKAAAKGAKIDPADVFNQQTADDVIHLLKELLL